MRWERIVSYDRFHGFCHIQGDLSDPLPLGKEYLLQNSRYFLGFRAFHHRHQGPLLAMGGFVRDDRVEFSVRERHLVDGELAFDVMREQHPVLGMIFLGPGVEIAEVFFVLLFKLFSRNLVGFGDGGERYRFGFSLPLLKNPQIPFRVVFRGRRV